jgi:hypothetical protein
MRAVDDQAFAPGTPEVQLDEVPNQPIWSEGKRARIGSVVLTNDRILFIKATSLAEITRAAAVHLPGAQIRRHLFYRYSLTWRRRRCQRAPSPTSGPRTARR